MDQFEIVAITLSFVLGLGMSHLLWSTASAVRAREDLKLHWLPLTWAVCIFVQHAAFWFAALSIDLSIGGWTWSWYLHILLLAVLLFASGALVLPSESQQRVGNLMEDFRKHGRLALLPLAAHQLLWVPTNIRASGYSGLADLLTPGTFVNFILVALALLGFRAKSVRLQAMAAFSFLGVLIWATTFLWFQNAF